MLRGPSNRPRVFLPAALALALLIRFALHGRWLALVVVVAGVALWEAWDRFGPQRRAGRVRRSWPWHGD